MKKILPWGNRVLVRRRPIGDKLGKGVIVAAETTAERPTDVADVVFVPNHTFIDKELLSNAEEIVSSVGEKARSGDADALNALLDFNHFFRAKQLKVGDVVFISKYVGTDFYTSEDTRPLTVVDVNDIMGKGSNE